MPTMMKTLLLAVVSCLVSMGMANVNDLDDSPIPAMAHAMNLMASIAFWKVGSPTAGFDLMLQSTEEMMDVCLKQKKCMINIRTCPVKQPMGGGNFFTPAPPAVKEPQVVKEMCNRYGYYKEKKYKRETEKSRREVQIVEQKCMSRDLTYMETIKPPMNGKVVIGGLEPATMYQLSLTETITAMDGYEEMGEPRMFYIATPDREGEEIRRTREMADEGVEGEEEADEYTSIESAARQIFGIFK